MAIVIYTQAGQLDPSTVGHRELGFGQPVPQSCFEVRLRLKREDLLSVLAESYRQYVEETVGMSSGDEDLDPLEKAGHPPFAQVLSDRDLLEFVIKDCLFFQFLDQAANSQRPEVVINDVVRIEKTRDEVEAVCLAWRAQPPYDPIA